jgi:hypothetical protein
MGLYSPIIYASDFWLLNSHLILLNNETSPENLTVTLRAGTFNKEYFGYQKQFLLSQKQNEAWGLQTASDYNEYKRVWLETDPWLLGITCLVSILHTIFEFLAFKSDISFWRGKDSMEGISVKSLYIELGMSIVI